ncbi:Uncharacterized protein FWK35_00003504 [Aphis craccivora]|uniref:Uncharacterized protein n=1 Tax=Aphis craccivora TaxID=307492 RepID=A0A6G0ZQY4_APHCR|nr:Uncharacterized protein FWK35_00003504 [Aphis craccivora]
MCDLGRRSRAVVRGGARMREKFGTQFHFYRGRLESKRTATRTDARARPRNYNAALGEGTRGTAACALATRTTKAPATRRRTNKYGTTKIRNYPEFVDDESNSHTDRCHAVATLPAMRDATKFRRATDDISRTRPDERTRFTITMSSFHGHTPTSATAFDSAAPVGGDGGGSVVHTSKRVGSAAAAAGAKRSKDDAVPPRHPFGGGRTTHLSGEHTITIRLIQRDIDIVCRGGLYQNLFSGRKTISFRSTDSKRRRTLVVGARTSIGIANYFSRQRRRRTPSPPSGGRPVAHGVAPPGR